MTDGLRAVDIYGNNWYPGLRSIIELAINKYGSVVGIYNIYYWECGYMTEGNREFYLAAVLKALNLLKMDLIDGPWICGDITLGKAIDGIKYQIRMGRKEYVNG